MTDRMKCSVCHVLKPPDAFHRNANMKRGRNSACIECTRKRRGSKPFQGRIRVRPGYVRCGECGKDLPESSFPTRSNGRGPDTYCLPCDRKRRNDVKNALYRTDPQFRKDSLTRNKKAIRKRVENHREDRKILRRYIARMIRRLQNAHGVYLHEIAKETGVGTKTLQRWTSYEKFMPTLPALERAKPVVERMLREHDSKPGVIRLSDVRRSLRTTIRRADRANRRSDR